MENAAIVYELRASAASEGNEVASRGAGTPYADKVD